MQIDNPSSDRLAEKLIHYLRQEFGNPTLDYHSPLIPLQGGYETYTYSFQLKYVDEKHGRPLVLRLYPPRYGADNARRESAIQNVLAGVGYPVAKSYVLCTDPAVLGGAFYVMDHLPGKPLMMANPSVVPELLGKTHAELHALDPTPVVQALIAQGIEPDQFKLADHDNWMSQKSSNPPWIRAGLDWLVQNRPPEPDRLAVCHGDFHALNLLVEDNQVTGVLDWPGFAIADPVMDIANTLVLTTIPARHLIGSMEGYASIDWEYASELYLEAYRSRNPADLTHVDYYKVRRCVLALIQGSEGHRVWQHSGVASDLAACIRKTTGVKISVPG